MAFQLWLRITRGLAALTLGTGLAFAAEPPSILPGPDVQPFADVTWNAQAGVPMPNIYLPGFGDGPYSCDIVGTPPPGISFSLAGASCFLSGTPTEVGTFTFRARTVGAWATAWADYTYIVAPPDIVMSPASGPLPGGHVGDFYSQVLPASGGTAPYAYTLATGALPPGLTLSPGGLISGTLTSTGAFTFSVRVNDATTGPGAPYGTTVDYSISVTPAPPITNHSNATFAFESVNNPIPLSVSGGAATSLSITASPAHGTIGVGGGGVTSLTYTPHAGYFGTDYFTYFVSNSGGNSGAATVSITVAPPPPAITSTSPSSLTAGTTGSIQLVLNGRFPMNPSALSAYFTKPGGSETAVGYSASYSGLFASQLSISLPASLRDTVGTANIRIVNDVGEANYQIQINPPAPVVSSVSPAVVRGGQDAIVTINGTALAPVSSLTVTPPGGSATVLTPTSMSATQIVVTLPAALLTPSGLATLAVTTPGGSTSANLTVDATPPGFAGLPSNIAVGTDPGLVTAAVSWTPPTATDNRPGASVTQTAGPAPGSTFPIGVTTITYRAEDAVGNTATASFTVTVTDDEPPVIVDLPADMAFTLDYPDTTRVVTWTPPTAADNAPGVTIVQIAGPAPGAAFPLGVTTVTYLATDAAGLTATASFTVTLIQTPPGQVRFVVNNADDGVYAFTSPTAALNFSVSTSGGTGSSGTINLPPGSYALSFTTPGGVALNSASCSPATSTVNASARTATLAIASNVLTVCTLEALPSRRATVEMLGAALDASARLVIANAPDLARRIGRLNGGGAPDGSASAFGKTFASGLPFSAQIGASEMRFAMSLSGLRARSEPGIVPASLAASAEPGGLAMAATDAPAALAARKGPRFDIWVEGVIARFDAAANSEGDFAILHAGADWLVTDDVLLGVAVQGDWLDMDTASGSLKSDGWLAGPYFTARLSPNLYLDARAAWGGASFEVSPFGTYTDTVDSDRALYSVALIGEFTSGRLTIRPEGRITWYRETTDSYTDSLSVFIPEVEIRTGEFSFGPSFEWTVAYDSGATLRPNFGFDLIWTFEQENTATAFTGAPGLDDTGVRGRIDAGLAYLSPQGISLGAAVFYDGIGQDDFEAWGGRATLRFGF